MNLESCAREYLEGLGAPNADLAVQKMAALDELVAKWSDRLGLTGFDSEETRWRRYFLEALAALPYLPREGEVVDIGSGGGSPALPLAIVSPGTSFRLFEARRRKAWFLEEAVSHLSLENVRVEARRFEGDPGSGWSAVTCRGVRLGRRLLRDIERGLASGGAFLWFSGEGRLAEARDMEATGAWASVRGPVALHSDSAAGAALLICVKR